ncbi:PhzF family phenazine biosynthesis isomerase [Enterococcus sp. LJL51]|uniref:PhzF family phenazine biosynthesis isomerase n=1 Tax=Enterococcus sp. LJL51 TaxID=3416656 RepID=UPI003CF60097
MECKVIQVDAFTRKPDQGNPAGVILNGDDYTEEEMQKIAKEVGFNECVFVCSSDKADVRLRYFTPGHETPLCGHATMGAMFLLSEQKQEDYQWSVETLAGVIQVDYETTTQEMTMQQADAQFIPFNGDKESLCRVMGISSDSLVEDLPIVYGNTGSWTLIVPVKEGAVLDQMIPQTAAFPTVLKEMPKSSIHPFAASKNEGTYVARHFSSPFSGTIEDSVTGTASGVMGAYLLAYDRPLKKQQMITVVQGKHVGREGQLTVLAEQEGDNVYHVSITGTACRNKEMTISL